MTQTVRLIRSKGVGVFFVTQVPDDVPASVLGQLGNRVQHALRAFTPDDAKALKAAASTYPTSEFYDVEELLTQMGIGEAAVTTLSDEGVPTPGGAHAAARARVADGPGRRRGRRGEGVAAVRQVRAARGRPRARARSSPPGWSRRSRGGRPRRRRSGRRRPRSRGARRRPPGPGGAEALGDFLRSREGKAMQRKVMRGVFGMLKKRL